MKRFVLLAVLALLSPMGLVAASAPGASAAVVSAVRPFGIDLGNFCQSEAQISPTGSDNGIPVYHLTQDEEGECLSGIHACRSLGNDGTTQGVECADLYYGGLNSAGDLIISSVAEGYCQPVSGGAMTQCANITVSFDFNTGNGESTSSDPGLILCGHSNGPCMNNRNEVVADFLPIPSGCGGPGSVHEVWTVDYTDNIIQLPGSDDKVISHSNLASQHAIVCESD